MFRLLKKLFGSAQERRLKGYWKIVRNINTLEEVLIRLPDLNFQKKTLELRDRYKQGETLDDLLPEAYALVKCACRYLNNCKMSCMGQELIWDMIPFDVQMIGAIALHYGNIAEMQTGEGKTLTAVFPAYLHSLSNKAVHIVTVNDYLAQRDCEWNSSLFDLLGVTHAFLLNNMAPPIRKHAYQQNIVYGTSSEFGFDYLRDNSIALGVDDQAQKEHSFAIIDEIDFILIDDARTPLRISGPSNFSCHMYDELKVPAYDLVSIQKEVCNRLANKAWKILTSAQATSVDMDSFSVRRSKEEEKSIEEGIRYLWIVSKGMPKNKLLKRAKELPFIRDRLDQQDLQAYGDMAKEERSNLVSQLLILVNERSNDFELTDVGVRRWVELQKKHGKESLIDHFEMLDLGEEIAKIEQDEKLDSEEKKIKKAEFYQQDLHRKERVHNINQLLRAHLLMERDVDYIVQDGKIVIIDENTGRAQPGRRYSEGLHQALEAKENLSVQLETITYATITLQNYFRMYEKLSGMSGTAITDAQEFSDIYKLEVISIPTRKPCMRKEFDDEIYMTEREKHSAILKHIKEVHSIGRPILIGTRSVDESERMSRLLSQGGLSHTVLNAKYHAKEAEIISRAGARGSITISTNMAGRGTDIRLGDCVANLGGLHVIGSRHFSRRNDRQLIGRCARQGDPGSSIFFGSFEDDLMRLFASPKILRVMGKFRPPEGESISAPMLTKTIETAQKRIEQRNYSIRKHTLEYDNVVSKQREHIYRLRQDILSEQEEIKKFFSFAIEYSCKNIVKNFYDQFKMDHRSEELISWIRNRYPISCMDEEWNNDFISQEKAKELATKEALSLFEERLSFETIAVVSDTESHFLSHIKILRWNAVRRLDHLWQQHLQLMDYTKAELPLRVGGYRDPLLEFKHEALELFQDTIHRFYLIIGMDALRLDGLSSSDTGSPTNRGSGKSWKTLQTKCPLLP